MSKTLIGLIVAILALGVAIYFFQGKVFTTTSQDTVPATSETQTQQEEPKVLPPTMEDGTIQTEPATTSTQY